jgi:predicted metal-dependent peptidase
MNIQQLKEDISDIQAVLSVQFPFIASLGARCRIVASEKIPAPAGVSKDNYLLINPNYWEQLMLKDRVYIYAHEVCHIAFQHNERKGNRKPNIWNIVVDAEVNDSLDEVLSRNVRAITMHDISILINESLDRTRKYSAEELYDKLIKNAITIEYVRRNNLCDGNDLTDLDSEGTVIQEGDEEINNSSNGEIREKLWQQAIAQAYSVQKSIGTVPAGISRIVDRLLKPKVRWQNILKKEIAIGIGKNVIGDWRKRSRKVPEMFPGLRREQLPTIWNLVDTSGSIDEETLRQFISEIYAQARETRVKAIAFDAQSYEILEANTQSDVVKEIARKLKGGGGTVIKDALRKTLKAMQYGDIVVVLTDGDIWDKEEPEVLELARMIKHKASTSLVVYTNNPVPFWKNIKID